MVVVVVVVCVSVQEVFCGVVWVCAWSVECCGCVCVCSRTRSGELAAVQLNSSYAHLSIISRLFLCMSMSQRARAGLSGDLTRRWFTLNY